MQETFFLSFIRSYAFQFHWNHRLTTFSYDATRLIRDTVVSMAMVAADDDDDDDEDEDEDDVCCDDEGGRNGSGGAAMMAWWMV